jgi:hypothetical protein
VPPAAAQHDTEGVERPRGARTERERLRHGGLGLGLPVQQREPARELRMRLRVVRLLRDRGADQRDALRDPALLGCEDAALERGSRRGAHGGLRGRSGS